MCTTQLEKKDNLTSSSQGGTIFSVPPEDLNCRLCEHEAQYFEEFQLHARSRHAGPQGFANNCDGRMEGDARSRGRQRARQQVGQEWSQGIDESERQISRPIRGYAEKVHRRTAKA